MNVFSVCVKRSVIAFITLFCAWAQAEEKAIPAAPDPMASAGKGLIFLVLIILLIIALAWALSRLKGQGFVQSNGNIRVLESQTLGMKEKIAVIQVGHKQMVVGITPQQITHLADLDEPLEQSPQTGNVSFSELLKKAIRQ